MHKFHLSWLFFLVVLLVGCDGLIPDNLFRTPDVSRYYCKCSETTGPLSIWVNKDINAAEADHALTKEERLQLIQAAIRGEEGCRCEWPEDMRFPADTGSDGMDKSPPSNSNDGDGDFTEDESVDIDGWDEDYADSESAVPCTGPVPIKLCSEAVCDQFGFWKLWDLFPGTVMTDADGFDVVCEFGLAFRHCEGDAANCLIGQDKYRCLKYTCVQMCLGTLKGGGGIKCANWEAPFAVCQLLAQCEDFNPCTDDNCFEGQCLHDFLPLEGSKCAVNYMCVGGECISIPPTE